MPFSVVQFAILFAICFLASTSLQLNLSYYGYVVLLHYVSAYPSGTSHEALLQILQQVDITVIRHCEPVSQLYDSKPNPYSSSAMTCSLRDA